MKKFVVILAAAGMVAACTSKDTPEVIPSKVFKASIEQGTRTYTENHKVYWYHEDAISIFDRGNAEADNVKYTFAGEDGATSGAFTAAAEAPRPSGTLQNTYGVYPYLEDNIILSEGKVIAYILPRQYYEVDSFSDAANAMVAASSDHQTLEFKNVAGYLKLRLYGDNSTPIQGVIVESNNGEYIAGDVLVEMLPGETPVISPYPENEFASTYATVSLPTSPEISLNPSSSSPLDVWVALTPGTIESGITVTVVGTDEREFTYKNTKPLTIKRGTCTSTAPLEVTFPEVHEDLETKAYIEENLAGNYIFNITAGYDSQVYENAITISYKFKVNSNVHLEGTFIDCYLSVDATFDPMTGLLQIPSDKASVIIPKETPIVGYLMYVSGQSIMDSPVSFSLRRPHTLTHTSRYTIYIIYVSGNSAYGWDWVKTLNSITYQGSASSAPRLVGEMPATVRGAAIPTHKIGFSSEFPLTVDLNKRKGF